MYLVKYESWFIIRTYTLLCFFGLHFSYLFPWQLCAAPLQRDYVLAKAFLIPALKMNIICFLLSLSEQILIEQLHASACAWRKASIAAFIAYDILEVSNKHVGDNNLACRQRSKPAVSLLAWKSIERQSRYESRQHAKAVCCKGEEASIFLQH